MNALYGEPGSESFAAFVVAQGHTTPALCSECGLLLSVGMPGLVAVYAASHGLCQPCLASLYPQFSAPVEPDEPCSEIPELCCVEACEMLTRPGMMDLAAVGATSGGYCPECLETAMKDVRNGGAE
jgi:hypothetical protein